jgi:large subunit ribosomal protein L9
MPGREKVKASPLDTLSHSSYHRAKVLDSLQGNASAPYFLWGGAVVYNQGVSMKVVFLSDLPGVGQAGQVKDVAEGFARNYLIPRGLALPATADVVQNWEEKKKGQVRRQAKEREGLVALGQRLDALELKLKAKAGSGQKLYGSITSADIAAELSGVGIDLDRRQIELAAPIKELGQHVVVVRLAPGISAQLRVNVEAI